MFTTRRSALRLVAFASLPLFASGGAALAQDATRTSQMVQISDLDLHTEAGAAQLRLRLAHAAGRVCGNVEMIGSPDFASYDRCVRQAQADAGKTADVLVASVRSDSRFASANPAQ